MAAAVGAAPHRPVVGKRRRGTAQGDQDGTCSSKHGSIPLVTTTPGRLRFGHAGAGSHCSPPASIYNGCMIVPSRSQAIKDSVMAEAFILSAVRTPIGKYLGAFADVPAPQLGAVVLAEALRRAGAKPDQIDE